MRLEDQFYVEEDVQLVKLRYFCNPVTKFIGEESRAAAPDEDHLTCYIIKPKERVTGTVSANNQLGETEFMTRTSELLCVPTRKLDFEISDDPDCPGGEGCCCNMPDGAGGTRPDCAPGFECRRQANPTNTNDAIQVCVPTGTPAGAPLQSHSSQPPFCRS